MEYEIFGMKYKKFLWSYQGATCLPEKGMIYNHPEYSERSIHTYGALVVTFQSEVLGILEE